MRYKHYTIIDYVKNGFGWNFPQMTIAGARPMNLGVYIAVNGYNARSDDVAQTAADKINGMIHEEDSVFK